MNAEGLEASGQLIWNAYAGDRLDAASAALVRELARCADTLDRLDGLARGRRESWVVLAFDEMGEIHLSVDKILDQRRNHQLAFKQLIAEIRAAKIPINPELTKTLKDQPTQQAEETPLEKARRMKAERERRLG
jgi:hypothetical protein